MRLPPDAGKGRGSVSALPFHLPVERLGDRGEVQTEKAERFRRTAVMDVTAHPAQGIERVIKAGYDVTIEAVISGNMRQEVTPSIRLGEISGGRRSPYKTRRRTAQTTSARSTTRKVNHPWRAITA